MSTEHDFQIGSTQYNFLLADLKAVNRSITPWIIFSGHQAMYINSYYNSGNASDLVVANLMRKNLEPLFMKYKVNLGVYGKYNDDDSIIVLIIIIICIYISY